MKELICIVCPKGCHLKVEKVNDEYIVTGNSCNRGKVYGINEVTNPTRMITSTIKVIDGQINLVPVVTSKPIPKGLIFDVMKEINNAKVKAPIKIKDVIIKNVLSLDVDIVATRNIERKENEK